MRSLFGQFLVIFLPLALVTSVIVMAVYWNQRQTDRTVLELRERSHVDVMARLVVGDFRATVADLMVLAEGPPLQALLSADSPAARGQALHSVAEEFRLFANQKQFYDQIRFIDVEGNEVVRVNLIAGQAQVVPEMRLQTKLDRYYFTDSLKLGRGELFVSPFDLNVEEGRIESPHKPTIRFATPVFDASGKKRGIVVVNYLGAKLLARLDEAAAGATGRPMLVNREGYWLKGLRPEDEWGFMFDDRHDATMAQRHTDAWRTISQEQEGRVIDDEGWFTFTTVHHTQQAIDAVAPGTTRAKGNSSSPRAWKLISYVSADVLDARLELPLRQSAYLGAALGAVLATVSLLLAQANLRNKRVAARALHAERLAAIGEAMAALAHESRNALQRSQAGLEMLGRRIADRPESLELLGEIQQAQYYLHDLYEQVRSYAAPVNLRRTLVDVVELVSETWRQLEVARRDRMVTLAVDLRTNDARCMADRGALAQVLRNVLENALAASPEGGRIVVCLTDASIGGKVALELIFRDQGPGLDPEARRRLFEPFFTTKQRGTGLGMTIVRRFVDAHRGTIRVGNATSGPGAEVVISLPRGDLPDVSDS